MKKAVSKQIRQNEDMRPEYDFSTMKGAVRGKYFKAYRAGHKVEIHKADGTSFTQHFKLEDGAVMLEPDVKKYFPNSESVNKTLRSLIAILPAKRRTLVHTK
jgi:glutamine synthetase